MTENRTSQVFPSLPVLLSVHDAEKIGLSPSAFYRMLHREDIPTVVIGGRKFLYRDKFIAWIESQTGGVNNV